MSLEKLLEESSDVSTFAMLVVIRNAALRKKVDYLIEKIEVMNNAVDNECPDMALQELRRTKQKLENWE
jgi:hypothetical protein